MSPPKKNLMEILKVTDRSKLRICHGELRCQHDCACDKNQKKMNVNFLTLSSNL